ncbi:MAG: ATP synthase F1 subunit gamma [Ignavibacteriales bacterium]|nr:ATP synthase F1 subunit gamma [Ignavibacteriales bacterium]
MATLREIRRRVTSVTSTQKITKAMKMVAAAKLRRAQEALVSARPYARKMNELLRHLVTKVDPSIHPLLHEREIKRVVLVVVAGDRGMCGAFNGNIIKAAVDHVNTHYSNLMKEPDGVRIVTVGKKATDFFVKRNYNLYAQHIGLFGNLHIGYARTIIQQLIDDYLKGEFDKVEVIYNEFKSVIQQRIIVEQILPIPPEQIQKTNDIHALAQVDYIFEPSSSEIIDVLLPKHLNFLMWHVLLESSTAEEGARMTAMNNATENAKELIRDLTLSYNKARQASITKELLEIVSGAEALKKAS